MNEEELKKLIEKGESETLEASLPPLEGVQEVQSQQVAPLFTPEPGREVYITREPEEGREAKIFSRREKQPSPEVYLVPETQERPLPEHRKELLRIKKDLESLKREGNTARQKEKLSMDKIDHFLKEMDTIKTNLEVVAMPKAKQKKVSQRKK